MVDRLTLAALAAATAILALVAAATLLPYGSINRDESTYVEFADVLATGRLTLDADVHRPFRPWASGIVDGRIVMKYTPPWPAVLAVVGDRAAPAAVGALAVLLVHALARRIGRNGRGPLAAAAFFALSPLIVIQSATALAYLFQLAIGLAAAVLLLRRTTASAAAAGVLAGLAAFARPFDAVLLIGPFAAVTLWRHRRLVVPFVVGGLPWAGGLFVYNANLLDNPFRPPFTVTGPTDGFGFGDRGVFPGATVPFDAWDGVVGMVTNGGWLVAWAFGGPLLVGLAVLGYRKLGPSDARRALTILVVVYPLGYLGFWGSYAVVHFWRGAATLGPFYHLPMLVPLVVFAGHGLVGLRPRHAVGALTACAVVTAAWLPPKLTANREVTDVYAVADRAVDRIDAGDPAVLLAPDRGVRGYDSWTPFLHNRPDLDQPLLFADERGGPDLDLVDRFPDRRLLRLVPRPTTYRPTAFRVERLAVTADEVDVTITPPPDAKAVKPYLVIGRRETHQPLPVDGRVRWSVDPQDDRGVVAAGVDVTGTDGRRRRYEQRMPYRRLADGRVELLVPGRGFRRLHGTWVAADVAEVVRTAPVQGT